MGDRRNKITSRQLMYFIISAQAGIAILALPARLAEVAGHDGWITVVLTSMIAAILAVIAIKLMERYGDKNIFDINKTLYGKYIGTFINIIVILVVLIKGVLNIRMFTEIVKILVLRLTPPGILTFFILAPTVYFTWYGLKPICRFASHILVIFAGVFLLFLAIYRFINIDFLLPVGESGFFSIAKGVPDVIYSLAGFSLVVVIYPEITDKKKAIKNVMGAIIITTIFIVSVVVVTTGFFGEMLVSRLTLPFFSLSRAYKAPIFERIDFLFLIVWFPAMAMSVRAYFFCAFYAMTKALNIKKTTFFLLLFTVVMVFLSRILRDAAQVFSLFDIYNMVEGSVIFSIIILDFLLSFIIKRGVRK